MTGSSPGDMCSLKLFHLSFLFFFCRRRGAKSAVLPTRSVPALGDRMVIAPLVMVTHRCCGGGGRLVDCEREIEEFFADQS